MEPPNPSKLITQYFASAANSWRGIRDELWRTFENSDQACLLRDRPATNFVLTWMRELKAFESTFGDLFSRGKRAPAADSFTAAVAISLSQYLAVNGFCKAVECEKKLTDTRG